MQSNLKCVYILHILTYDTHVRWLYIKSLHIGFVSLLLPRIDWLIFIKQVKFKKIWTFKFELDQNKSKINYFQAKFKS